MLDEPEIDATAIHEAGHAVISYLLGNQVPFVTMGNDNERPMVSIDGSNKRADIMVGFAGMWAQQLFSSQAPTDGGCSQDIRLMESLSGALEPDQTKRNALLHELGEQTRQMVVANEKNIRRVADFLMSYGDIGNPSHGPSSAMETLKCLIVGTPQKPQ